jgi:hypothetical protein
MVKLMLSQVRDLLESSVVVEWLVEAAVGVAQWDPHPKGQPLFKDQRQLSATYGKHNLNLILLSGREYGTASIEIHLKSCK